ncbi:MAG TPA: Ig-like domain-containing protein, partial [Vicinamibacterales bacterium]
WLSDTPTVATVTNSGLVTGVSNGRATVYVVSGGQQGQQVVRVVPDYQGRWSGGLGVTSCSETGIFASVGFCGEFPSGSTSGYSLAVSHAGEQITASASYGSLSFPVVTAPIRDDGTAAFTTTVAVTESGVTLTLEANWVINSLRVGELSGTVNEVWRVPNVSGEARLAQSIVQTVRSSTSAVSGRGDSVKTRAIRRLAGKD